MALALAHAWAIILASEYGTLTLFTLHIIHFSKRKSQIELTSCDDDDVGG